MWWGWRGGVEGGDGRAAVTPAPSCSSNQKKERKKKLPLQQFHSVLLSYTSSDSIGTCRYELVQNMPSSLHRGYSSFSQSTEQGKEKKREVCKPLKQQEQLGVAVAIER